MKRNISSHAIKAMAIAMAVSMGTTTAISGVVTGTVVNAYAETQLPTGVASATFSSDDSNLIITFTADGSNKFSGTTDVDNSLVIKNGKLEVYNGTSKDNATITVEGGDVAGNSLKISIPKENVENLDGANTTSLTVTFGDDNIKIGAAAEAGTKFECSELAISGTTSIDNVAPTVAADEVAYDKDAKTLTVTFSEKLKALGETTANHGFTVKNSSQVEQTIKNVKVDSSGAGNTLVITLGDNVALAEDTYTIGYEQKSETEVADEAGNKLATNASLKTFTVAAETEEDTTAPTIKEDVPVAYDKNNNTITLEASEPLTAVREETASTHGFTITKDVNKSAIEIESVEVKDNANTKIVITLKEKTTKLAAGDYTIGYQGEIIKDKATAPNSLAKNNNLAKLTVADETASNPTVNTTAIYNADKKEITLTANMSLKALEATAADHGFTVKDGAAEPKSVKIKDVRVGDGKQASDKIIITLDITEALANGTYTIDYTKPSNPLIVSNAEGNAPLETKAGLATFKVGDEAEKDFSATTEQGTYTFEQIGDKKEVILVGFQAKSTLKEGNGNSFSNGVLTIGQEKYTLTQIGKGQKVEGLTDKALEGHTANVTTIGANAFDGNTNVTELSFPKVTNVGDNAFKGANALTNIDLGSQATGAITIPENAFEGATKIANVTTNAASKDVVETAAKKGNANVKVDVAITEDQYNAKDAKIEKGKYYITGTGLLFEGIDTNKLAFIGTGEFTAPTEKYKLDGSSKDNAYYVTFSEDKITLKSETEGTQPPVEENEFTATVGTHTLTFEKLTDATSSNNGTVALTKVEATQNTKATSGNLSNGVLTVGETKYNLTQLGDGENSLGNFANDVLKDNLNNVTTVKANAFKDNTTITTITLPAVTTIEANAFTGTTALTTIDLGNNEVTITQGAFTGAGNGTNLTIKTNNDKTSENITNNGGGTGVTVDNPAPTVVSGEVTKSGSEYILTLTLSENVFATQTPENNDFTVQSGTEAGKALSPNAVTNVNIPTSAETAKNTITLTLTNPVNEGDKVTVAYTPSAKTIKDTSKDAKTLAKFDAREVTNSIKDETVNEAPTVESAVVNEGESKIVTLTLSENVFTDAQDLNNSFGFTVQNGTEGGKALTDNPVTSVVMGKGSSAASTTIKLNLTNDITEGQKVTVAYTPELSKEIKDTDAKNPQNLAKFDANSIIVTNNIKDETVNEAPTIKSAVVNEGESKIITLTLSENVFTDANDLNNSFGFTVQNGTEGGKALTDNPVTSVVMGKGSSAASTTIKLNLTNDITEGQKVTVAYTPEPSKEIKDTDVESPQNLAKFDANSVTVTNNIKPAAIANYYIEVYSSPVVETKNGTITTIKSVGKANQDQINSVLISTIETIEANAFSGTKDLVLSFTNIKSNVTIKDNAFSGSTNLTLDLSGMTNASSLNISSSTFNGATGLKLKAKETDEKALAEKLGSNSDITINNKKPEEIINGDGSGNNGGGSGGGSSSGGGSYSSGSGAVIGKPNDNTENNNNNNSNNNNQTVVEDKELSFDVINLPSITGTPKTFGDVPANYWAKSYIDKLSTAGIINGSNGNFNPNGQTKRADVTIMLVNLLGLTPQANNKFIDVNPNAYYANYVGTASTYGIVNGSNGMFNPENVISRQDTMVMIAQILKGLELNVNTDTTSLTKFSDANNISPYANESVAILVNSGIISGNNGKLNPKSPVTRAEMATIMSKLYDVLAAANK